MDERDQSESAGSEGADLAAEGTRQKPVGQDEGEHGLGTKTGGLGGPDDPGDQESGTSSGGDADQGPTKDVKSVPGGGDALGPTPSGVAQEGEVEEDPDIATGSTESGPNPADDD